MFLFLFCSNLVICFLDICVMLGGLMGEKKNIEKKWLWKLFNRGKIVESFGEEDVCVFDDWKEL